MQSYFNSLKWDPSSRFSGFENSQMNGVLILSGGADTAQCERGYVTTYSPMGTQVCTATIKYVHAGPDHPNAGKISKSVITFECRYK